LPAVEGSGKWLRDRLFGPLSLWERVRVRGEWWLSRRPLTPALSRWEREKGIRVRGVAKKTYPCELSPEGRAEAIHGASVEVMHASR
jgi:hypothetical protein